MIHGAEPTEVLTLDEVAAYLRLPRETVLRQASQGRLPGRQVEDTWRFLKAAVDEWLRSHDSRTLLLPQARPLAADDSLTALRNAIYAARKRPELVTPNACHFRQVQRLSIANWVD